MTFDHIAAGGDSAADTEAFHDSSHADPTVSAENNYVERQAYADPTDQSSSLTSLPRTKLASQRGIQIHIRASEPRPFGTNTASASKTSELSDGIKAYCGVVEAISDDGQPIADTCNVLLPIRIAPMM